MRIAVITANPKLYSHQRLVEAAEKRGHRLETANIANLVTEITYDSAVSVHGDAFLKPYDAAILRHGTTRTNFGISILRHLELGGVWPLNHSAAIHRSRNKFHCMQILSAEGIAIPMTAYTEGREQMAALINAVEGPPAVIKVLDGAHGVGVELCETQEEASKAFDAFYRDNGNVMMQEYIKEAGGSDIRCIVIGGKMIAAMERRSAPGEFRSNLHQGGTAHPVEVTQEEANIAESAAKHLGLNFCGVDLLRSNRGPLVIEVNSSPGLEGIEAVTGLDIAGALLTYIEERLQSEA